jgi:N-acetylmuramoyl-L-alanine amidase
MFEIKDNFLYKDGERVSYKESPNHGGEITPEILVIHYTGDNSLQGALSWLTTEKSQVSAHLVIAKTGQVWQLLPFNVKSWHAGVSNYEGRSVGGSVNTFSIGIEHVGLGDEWPDAQIEASIGIIKALFEAYNLTDCVGHMDVAPARKADPGPLYFPILEKRGVFK